MENEKPFYEYKLSSIDIIYESGNPIYEEDGNINFIIMKRILGLMDDGGNYSDSERKGIVGGIVFTEKNGNGWFVYSPSQFIEHGRPLKINRRIEDIVLENLLI